MRIYRAIFTVQADDLAGALGQAEEYLNTGDRVIDCQVFPADEWLELAPALPDGRGRDDLPRPAPVLPDPAARGIPRLPSRE